ncbi:MAG TPA: hypothetical protein VGP26_05165 [Actinophytocola sp.]|jgi:hypothetical protein|nr:hypothetical protein [Actinophytocola sp.]
MPDVEQKPPGLVRARLRALLAVLVLVNVLATVATLFHVAWSSGVLTLVVLFFFATLALVWVAAFSVRDEPMQRLVDLIKAMRGKRR